ncbi:MAG: NAD(+)/NADH kinase [Solirubrobacterales bacterium]|nr:NAD(+)/NADH kinase [Solirubrobacterales bacterium]
MRAAVITHHFPNDNVEPTLAALRAASVEFDCELIFDTVEPVGAHDGVEYLVNPELRAVEPDVAIVLGGDGSILRSLRTFAGTRTPTFGFNFGTIGFLTTAEREALPNGLKLALSGAFDTLDLPALRLKYGEIDVLGVNDVSFHRARDARVAEVAYGLAGEPVGRVRCDGVVAATPAGSTGYNLANNGPILAWGVEGYVVSFIAPHTLTARALVAAPGDVLGVTNAGRRDELEILVDGLMVGTLPVGETAEVSFEDNATLLAQLPGSNFYDRFREKFGKLAS